MGLWDDVLDHRAERAAVRAADPVTLEEFGYLLGQTRGNSFRTKAGVNVGPRGALGISAWWRGTRYLTETISGLPVHTYRDTGDVRSKRADPAWMQKPDIDTPWYALIEHWLMSELHKGNAYAFKLRDPLGRVTGLRPLHPDRVVPGRSSDGVKMFQVDGRDDVGYTSREILHIPGLSYDGVCGLNPIQAHAETLGLVKAADEYAARHFGQGSHLRAYLSLPQKLTTSEADALKARWERFHSGMANASEFGVLGNGAEYKTVSLDPQQTQLLETRQFNVTEIARILGVVPHKLYDLSNATYTNIEHQAIESVTDGIVPWVQRFEAWINFDPDLMRAGNFIEWQIEGLLRGDTASRYEAYSKAVGVPWMAKEEARRLENLPPEPTTGEIASPLNMTQLARFAELLEESAR
jgi:HK97 family phage portal protein